MVILATADEQLSSLRVVASGPLPGLQGVVPSLLAAAFYLAVGAVCALVCLGVGFLFQRKLPERTGRLLLALWLVFLAGGALLLDAHGYDGRVPAYSAFAPALFALFFYFNADRRFLARRIRWLAFLYLAAMGGQLGKPSDQPWPPHDFPLAQVLVFAANVLGVLLICGGLITQVYGRAAAPRPPTERARRSWLVTAGVVAGVGVLALLVVALLAPPALTAPLPPSATLVIRAGVVTVCALLPVPAAFALARGDRYDGAALMRNGVIYGAIVPVLAVIYAASLIGIHYFFALPAQLEQNLATPFLILVAALLIVVYRPLRAFIQDGLESRFFRRHFVASHTLAEFQAGLSVPRPLPDLATAMADVVQRMATPRLVTLWAPISSAEATRVAERSMSGHVPSETPTSAGWGDSPPDPVHLLRLVDRPHEDETSHVLVSVAADDSIGRALPWGGGVIVLDEVSSGSSASRNLQAAGFSHVLPLAHQGEPVGLLGVGPRMDGAPYTFDDRDGLRAFADLAAPVYAAARNRNVQEAKEREHERMDQELRTAQRIQQALLPKETPTLDGWRIAAYYQPAREVGGDFYDFLPLADGRLGLVIGDVSGKGIPAALVMATTRSMLRAVAETAQQVNPPGVVLARVNELLCGDLPGSMFVTCFYALLDPATGTMRFANAGQDLPVLRREDGSECELRATGMPLGLMPESVYDEREAQLDEGASVLLYSDGLVEAHNAKREMFGVPRLLGAVRLHGDGETVIPTLLRDLTAFAGVSWDQEDDITLVLLRRSEAAEARVRANMNAVAEVGMPA